MTKLLPLLLLTALLSPGASDPKAEKEVLAAVEAWKQAMIKKDGAALAPLLHDDLSYGHSNGLNETKTEVMQVLPKVAMESYDMSATTVRTYGNTALVKGKVDIRNKNATGGGSTLINLDILQVWMKSPQGWQLVARQATRLTPAP